MADDQPVNHSPGEEPWPGEEPREEAPSDDVRSDGVAGEGGASQEEADAADEELGDGPEREGDPDGHGEEGSRVKSHVERAERSFVYVAETMTLYQYGVGGAGGPPFRREITRDQFESLPADRLFEIRSALEADDDSVEPVVQCLQSHRIALVVGERGLGKGALCRVAAARMADGDPAVEEVLRAVPLEREVRWRPERLFADGAGFFRRILIFEDALEGGNREAARFVERLDEARLFALRDALASAGSYLLMSFDAERFPGRREGLVRLGVLAEVAPPSGDRLRELLHRRLADRRIDLEREDPELADAAERILDEREDWLAAQLRTYPRSVRFVDEFLAPVARGELTLEQALDRVENLEYWLLTELPAEPPRWCFVLALTLASTDPRVRWVPWVPLHGLWRTVEASVEGAIRGEEAEDAVRFKNLSRLVVDHRFLARARSEARRLPYPGGEAVRFVDPSLAERLWRVLLGPGRALLTTLVPRLDALVRGDDPVLRSFAARALGRAGVLAPGGIAVRRIEGWLESDSPHAPALVGDLVGAGLAAGDPDYASGCLERVRRSAAKGQEPRASSAFIALVGAGMVAPERVLGDLRRTLTEGVVAGAPSAATTAGRIYARLEAEDSSRRGSRSASGPSAARRFQAAAYGVLGPRGASVLTGSRYTLAGLCFGGSPMVVLTHLCDWMSEGGAEGLAPWTSFLVLNDRGVLRLVERFPVTVPTGDTTQDGVSGRPHACSRIFLSGEDDEAPASLERFVEAAFTACGPFPGRLRTHLRKNLLKVLGEWVRTAAAVPVLRERGVSLFSRLLESRDDELKGAVFDLLRGAEGDDPEGGGRPSLKVEVLRQGLRGGSD
ncbi:MAG: hypothetical protein ACLF0P_01665 [Thermoanaerobaculia bacterium]